MRGSLSPPLANIGKHWIPLTEYALASIEKMVIPYDGKLVILQPEGLSENSNSIRT